MKPSLNHALKILALASALASPAHAALPTHMRTDCLIPALQGQCLPQPVPAGGGEAPAQS